MPAATRVNHRELAVWPDAVLAAIAADYGSGKLVWLDRTRFGGHSA